MAKHAHTSFSLFFLHDMLRIAAVFSTDNLLTLVYSDTDPAGPTSRLQLFRPTGTHAQTRKCTHTHAHTHTHTLTHTHTHALTHIHTHTHTC